MNCTQFLLGSLKFSPVKLLCCTVASYVLKVKVNHFFNRSQEVNCIHLIKMYNMAFNLFDK